MQFKNLTKTLNKKKKVGRAQSPIPKILLGWNKNSFGLEQLETFGMKLWLVSNFCFLEEKVVG